MATRMQEAGRRAASPPAAAERERQEPYGRRLGAAREALAWQAERRAMRAGKAARMSAARADVALDALRVRVRRAPLKSALMAGAAGFLLGAATAVARALKAGARTE